MMKDWPSDARVSEPVRMTMNEYAVSLGVKCDFCHVPGNWKADTKALLRFARRHHMGWSIAGTVDDALVTILRTGF